MFENPLIPQPDIPNYSKPQEQFLEEQKNSTGGDLQDIVVDKVRRITRKGQLDGS